MRILLTHAYTHHNKGDAGIVEGMINELSRQIPTAQVLVAGMEEPRAGQVTSFFYEAIYRDPRKIPRIVRTVYLTVATTIWALFYRYFKHGPDAWFEQPTQKTLHAYADCDLVIPVGGCYLRANRSIQSYTTILLHLQAIWLAVVLDKPVYMYSQSVGPFADRWLAGITARVIAKTKQIYVREEISEKLLKELRVPRAKIHRGIDAGFLVKAGRVNKVEGNSAGITVRDWLSPKAQEAYEQAISELIVYASRKYDYRFVLIPQVTASRQNDDDRVPAERIFRMTKAAKLDIVRDDLELAEIKTLYDSMSLFMGTRMHSNIFALTGMVPTIAIEYEYKTRGIMRELGLEEWVIKIEDVTFYKLRKLFDRLVTEQKHYRDYLQKIIPPYVERAREPVREILASYENN